MTMKTAIFCILAASLAGCAERDQPTRSAVVVGPYVWARPNDPPIYVELPPVPSGCIVRVYQIRPHDFPDAPRTKIDWADWLRAQGMIFPHGGFAAYFPKTGTLIIANTPDQLSLMDPV